MILTQQGLFKGTATGYFGPLTFSAVKAFQRAHSISAVGLVGPLTRRFFSTMTSASQTGDAEKFEGTVTAYSTGCFADGICSITVDGKKIITTVGRSQIIVGQVTGIPDFGSIENNVGAHAKVYAKKTDDGYTLYGSADYYVAITPVANRKLPSGSTPVGDISALIGTTWRWEKLIQADGSIVTPRSDVFSVTFGTDGKMTGKTDCNGFFGSYQLGSDGILSFGALGSTMMFCDNSQESVFTGAIQNVSSYGFEANGDLTLTLKGGASKMYFVKK